MEIFIDADGCPVTGIAIRLAKQYHIPCTVLCDTSHRIEHPDARTITVSKGIAMEEVMDQMKAMVMPTEEPALSARVTKDTRPNSSQITKVKRRPSLS